MFDRIVEKLLREAEAEGKFNQLSGAGRPLPKDNEDDNAEAWAANHLLKNQNLRPDWLEEDHALQAELGLARQALRRTWEWRAEALAQLGAKDDADAIRAREWAHSEWQRAQREFRAAIDQLNHRQRTLNLKVPLERFQRPLINVEAELRAFA